MAGYTPQYLSSLFSDEMGMSIQEFLQRLRMEEACRLLAGSDLPLSQIAAAVGYRDSRHFSKVFRRYQSLSPKEFRKSIEMDK